MVTAAVVGASGYTGGELLRLLIQHPNVELTAATSARFSGKPLHQAHPNLRGSTALKFSDRTTPEADVIFTCTPHGTAQTVVPELLGEGRTVLDLSADFRLSAAEYETWYGQAHGCPDLLDTAVYGLPEFTRDELPGARLVSGVGCFATSMNLALKPLQEANLLDGASIVVDGKIGSSAAGIEPNPAGMHSARSRSIRTYAPTEHRHVAEVQRMVGISPNVTVHGVELVRGVLATAHVLLPGDVPDEKALWRAWRATYASEPFVRIVKERSGTHRSPDPRLVAGSNFADVSFHVQPARAGQPGRIVASCAIDNLVKGAAGSAVQSMNIARGLPETAGLAAIPIFPA